MARSKNTGIPTDIVENIVDIDVSEEMRLLPGVRLLGDLLQGPARRKGRFQARPEAHPLPDGTAWVCDPTAATSSHPASLATSWVSFPTDGDAAIYDTMVRMAQRFTQRLPLIDGHGNFGSLDDGPAASRYTEARLTEAALAMTEDLDEDTVDMVPNYDNSYLQPEVLPAAIPNLLVNRRHWHCRRHGDKHASPQPR